jgi:predicted GTPase
MKAILELNCQTKIGRHTRYLFCFNRLTNVTEFVLFSNYLKLCSRNYSRQMINLRYSTDNTVKFRPLFTLLLHGI